MIEHVVSGDLDLLYEVSRDGWKASYFRAKCDNKGTTIVVICSTGDFIFGGFSDQSWRTYIECCGSDKAFLFYLKIPSRKVGPKKINIMQNECSNALYHDSYCGPTFGGGSELFIKSDSNSNSYSYSNLVRTYEIPPVQTSTCFDNSKISKESEIEMFQII